MIRFVWSGKVLGEEEGEEGWNIRGEVKRERIEKDDEGHRDGGWGKGGEGRGGAGREGV